MSDQITVSLTREEWRNVIVALEMAALEASSPRQSLSYSEILSKIGDEVKGSTHPPAATLA